MASTSALSWVPSISELPNTYADLLHGAPLDPPLQESEAIVFRDQLLKHNMWRLISAVSAKELVHCRKQHGPSIGTLPFFLARSRAASWSDLLVDLDGDKNDSPEINDRRLFYGEITGTTPRSEKLEVHFSHRRYDRPVSCVIPFCYENPADMRLSTQLSGIFRKQKIILYALGELVATGGEFSTLSISIPRKKYFCVTIDGRLHEP